MCTPEAILLCQWYILCFNFQSTSEAVVKKASMLSDMHFRNLRQKMLLKQRTEEAAKKLEVYTLYHNLGNLVVEHVCGHKSYLLVFTTMECQSFFSWLQKKHQILN